MRLKKSMLVLLIASLSLPACATMGDPPTTLYKRLGGREGISMVVGDFVTNMAGDSRVNARFKDMKGKKNRQEGDGRNCGCPCGHLGSDDR